MNKIVYSLIFIGLNSCALLNAMEDPNFDPAQKELEKEFTRFKKFRQEGYSIDQAIKKEEEYKRLNKIPLQRNKSGAKARVKCTIEQRRKAQEIPVIITSEMLSSFESAHDRQRQKTFQFQGISDIRVPFLVDSDTRVPSVEAEDTIDYDALTNSVDLMLQKDTDTNK